MQTRNDTKSTRTSAVVSIDYLRTKNEAREAASTDSDGQDDEEPEGDIVIDCESETSYFDRYIESDFSNSDNLFMHAQMRRGVIRRDVAKYLANVRKISNLQITEFIEKSDISQTTYARILISNGETTLGTMSKMVSYFRAPFSIKLESINVDAPAMIFPYSGGNPALYCARFFSQCRLVAGLSKKELDARLKTSRGKKAKSDGYVSKVENMYHKNGVSFDKLSDVATAAGFNASIVFEEA